MKHLIFLLFLLLAFNGWSQSPAINFSSSSSIFRPIFQLPQDGEQWQKQPASFIAGADYLVPFGKKDFISVGLQYRQWQYNSLDIYNFGCYCFFPQPFPPRPANYNYSLRTTYKEFAIPIQLWLYSKQKPWQVFSRVGFTPSYISNASVQKEIYHNKLFEFLNRDQFKSWNYSADLALGIQWNFYKKIHAYLAVNSQLYLRKNLLHFSNSTIDYRYLIPNEQSFNKAGIGLELGLQYSLR